MVKALPSAKRLETLAPSAGHLVHMPAHTYQRTGNYAGAAAANEAGARADREFIRKYGREGIYPMMYYNHNLDFGAASYAMIGNINGNPDLWWKLATIITCGTLAGAVIPEVTKIFTSTHSGHVRERKSQTLAPNPWITRRPASRLPTIRRASSRMTARSSSSIGSSPRRKNTWCSSSCSIVSESSSSQS